MNEYRKNFYQHLLDSYIASNKIFYFVIASVLLMAGYYFIRLPILSFSDTDLWYHLNGGRFFFQYREIPKTGFFSFIANSREWVNYYWLFQVLVYQIFSISGYYGLIIFKTVTFFSTLLIIVYILLKDEKHDKEILYFMCLFILFCIGMIPRYFAILRPHILSYFFIVLYLYLLESRSKAIIALPILTIFWSNLHGIEYPLIILIGLCYLIEFFMSQMKERTPLKKVDLFYIIPIVLSMWSILFNPYGFSLLDAPFCLAEYQDQYIKELRYIKIGELFSIKLYPFGDLMNTSFNILLIVAFLGCIKSIWRKKIRISHMMLFLGGLLLLSQGERFRYEAVLLALPALKYNPLISRMNSIKAISRSLRVFVAILLFSLSFIIINNLFQRGGKYPFSHSHLPRGVTTFLNHIRVGGSILNNPNYGGYLQWALNPNYKIFMDLQMVLFKDEDYFLIMNALNNRVGLTKALDQYHPDFIVEKRSNRRFKELIKVFPEYRLVFFDMEAVLYINNKANPQIAKKHELVEVNPYRIMDENVTSLSDERANTLLDELLSMQAIYPEGAIVNLKIGNIFKKRGDFDRALFLANNIIKNYPEFPSGYLLKGDIYMERKLFAKAVSSYKEALDNPTKGVMPVTYKKLALAYSKMGQHKKAYNHMKKAIPVFSTNTGYMDLWQLGNMSIRIGRIREGSILLRLASFKTPPEDIKLSERIRMQLKHLKPYTENPEKSR